MTVGWLLSYGYGECGALPSNGTMHYAFKSYQARVESYHNGVCK